MAPDGFQMPSLCQAVPCCTHPKAASMRVIAVLMLLLFSAHAFAQSRVEKFLDSTLSELKIQYPTDGSDANALSFLESFYNEALQSDLGELSPATAQRINAYMADGKAKNKHLLILFLLYQEHVGQAAAQGEKPNTEYQLACISRLESEVQRVYQKVPIIVYIYKAEALESAGRREEANALVAASLQKAPTSIPLKVYHYLNTKDETIKQDLVKNHAAHWMVQQFGIK